MLLSLSAIFYRSWPSGQGCPCAPGSGILRKIPTAIQEQPVFGLTTLGTIHPAIGIVAVIAGLVALARFREISTHSGAGRIFVIGTVLTCLTGLPIFRHGGFGPPHALAILTLVVLAFAYAGERAKLGGLSHYYAVLGYSFSFFLHFIPATAETL